jgi:hypothetical protein
MTSQRQNTPQTRQTRQRMRKHDRHGPVYIILVFYYTETVRSNRSSARTRTRKHPNTKSKLVSARFDIVIHLLLVFWTEKNYARSSDKRDKTARH